jgi:hypothetical protein
MAYKELEVEPPKRTPRLLTDLTLDELWEMQDRPARRTRI